MIRSPGVQPRASQIAARVLNRIALAWLFIDGSFELLADNGRHPAFYMDFCEVIADYFG